MENNQTVKHGGSDDESAAGTCVAGMIWVISILLIVVTFPFSLCVCIRMVQVSTFYVLQISIDFVHTYLTEELFLGIRKSCHLQTWTHQERWSCWPWSLFHCSMHGPSKNWNVF